MSTSSLPCNTVSDTNKKEKSKKEKELSLPLWKFGGGDETRGEMLSTGNHNVLAYSNALSEVNSALAELDGIIVCVNHFFSPGLLRKKRGTKNVESLARNVTIHQ